MKTEEMLLTLYKKPRLNFEEVCQAIGISKATAYTHRTMRKFPVPMTGHPLTADIRDVAAHLDHMRKIAA